ncbi:MAG: hypothetical protein MR837_06540 [Firmicutes bacterium]|nr:hypothetical protein [Bacillota bacterium]
MKKTAGKGSYIRDLIFPERIGIVVKCGYAVFSSFPGMSIDVIAILVIGWDRGFEQNPHAGPGRAVFRIGIHPGDDVLGHIRQHTVLDTAVDVDGADVPEDADAEAVISGPVSDGYGVIGEGGFICGIRTEAVRLIRHLGPAPVTLLIFPEAEGTSFL